jgi:hypothetical protein
MILKDKLHIRVGNLEEKCHGQAGGTTAILEYSRYLWPMQTAATTTSLT